MIELSTALLKNVQLLRRIIKQYTYGRIGRELQHLSLTVGAFERVLFTFITDEVLSADEEVDTRNHSALKDALPRLNRNTSHAVLSGGIGSLLRHASTAFKETEILLTTLHDSYDPLRRTKWKWGSIITTVVSLVLVRRYFRATSMARFLRENFLNRSSMKKIMMFLVVGDISRRIAYRFSFLRDIKICHCRILLTLRLFLLCQHLASRSRMQRTTSQRLLIDLPCVADYDDYKKNATVLLVEKVPVPADYYNRSSRDIGLRAFKLATNVFCASSGVAYSILGSNKTLWNVFKEPLMMLFVPYFLVRHNQAARYATRLLIDEPNFEIIRNAWSTLGERTPALFIHKLIAPKLPLRKKIYVDISGKEAGNYERNSTDIGVYLFSTRSVTAIKEGTWDGASVHLSEHLKACGLPQSRPVIFYAHGGGWFTRFLAQDMLNLSRWAEETGALIVYVGML